MSLDCSAIEPDLIAMATGEAPRDAVRRVERHVAECDACATELEHYRRIESAVAELRDARLPDTDAGRQRLLGELADLRSRIVRYTVFDSPLGPILLAATESGVSLVEYVRGRDEHTSWLQRRPGIELQRESAALEGFRCDLLDFLAGRRDELDWTLDFRFASSDFQRAVLEATSAVPFGAVSSYSGIARDIGRPTAVRAVAQALRHNPLPIVVPCHRIIGSSGSLVGYAGNRIQLKERLLGLEGVHTERDRRGMHVDRAAMYAWDHRGREYCLPTCGEISKLPIGAVTLIASPRQARSLGLTPCRDCKPDKNPLPAG